MPTGDQRVVQVLVLEDDPDIRETLLLVLSSDSGFTVEVVADVVSCLERLRVSDENAATPAFDVLLLDLVLRGGYLGTEVFHAAAQPWSAVRLPAVVVCTAHSGEYLARNYPEISASSACVIFKPFDIDELTTALRVAAQDAPDRLDS